MVNGAQSAIGGRYQPARLRHGRPSTLFETATTRTDLPNVVGVWAKKEFLFNGVIEPAPSCPSGADLDARLRALAPIPND